MASTAPLIFAWILTFFSFLPGRSQFIIQKSSAVHSGHE
jgi:hypothetical protein